MNVTALIWDFDGTLVDTRHQNLRITRRLLSGLTGRSPEQFPALADLETYEAALRRAVNWRDLYRNELGLTDEMVEAAGRLWAEYQLRDHSPVPLFEGIREALEALGGLPHGIVSQSAKASIRRCLRKEGVLERFDCVVGYEEVPTSRQKPAPDGLIQCIERLTGLRPGCVLFVGDHETDIATAANANEVFCRTGISVRVIAVAAAYCGPVAECRWERRPDYLVRHPREFATLLRTLMAP
jgi:HAD superfamily hydrolase (TIGR01549 family)